MIYFGEDKGLCSGAGTQLEAGGASSGPLFAFFVLARYATNVGNTSIDTRSAWRPWAQRLSIVRGVSFIEKICMEATWESIREGDETRLRSADRGAKTLDKKL